MKGQRILLFSFAFLALFSFGTYAFSAGLYNPGDTTDPSCLPLAADCYVDFNGNLVIGSAVTSGAAHRVLYEDASQDLAASSDFIYNGTTRVFSVGFGTNGTDISLDDIAETITLDADNGVTITDLAGGGSGFVAVDNTGKLSFSVGSNAVSVDATLVGDGSGTDLGIDLSHANLWTGTQTFNSIYSKGVAWTSRTSPNAYNWASVTYGNGLFVAIAEDGAGAHPNADIMTSPDGVTWTTQNSTNGYTWESITYGNGLFVAVASSGFATQLILTSPDGVTWQARSELEPNAWRSVTYGNGTFVAVASSGTNRVMTSTDGIVWNAVAASAANSWQEVTYGNGTFVAVASSGTNRVMTSPTGATWTGHASADEGKSWKSVTYGNGLFVAVGNDGTTDSIMTSPTGVTWAKHTSTSVGPWNSITYGSGLFVAVGDHGAAAGSIITSPDGDTWTDRTAPSTRAWQGITYGNGMFVAVANDGSTSNNIMSSGFPDTATVQNNNIYQGGITVTGDIKFPSLAVASAQGYVCFNTTTFSLSYHSTTCGASSERFKHDIETLSGNLDKVMQLRPVSFVSNFDDQPYVGFIAEEVGEIETRLVTYESDGTTIHGVNYAQFAPLLAGAIQELNDNFSSLDIDRDGSLASLIARFLGSAGNGLRRIFVGEVHTDMLCVGATCLNETQVQQILDSVGGSSVTPPPSDEGDGGDVTPPSGDEGGDTPSDSGDEIPPSEDGGDVTPPSGDEGGAVDIQP